MGLEIVPRYQEYSEDLHYVRYSTVALTQINHKFSMMTLNLLLLKAVFINDRNIATEQYCLVVVRMRNIHDPIVAKDQYHITVIHVRSLLAKIIGAVINCCKNK